MRTCDTRFRKSIEVVYDAVYLVEERTSKLT
jgi:hypothetical protein